MMHCQKKTKYLDRSVFSLLIPEPLRSRSYQQLQCQEVKFHRTLGTITNRYWGIISSFLFNGKYRIWERCENVRPATWDAVTGSQSAVTHRLSSMWVPTHLFVPSILITYLERVILVQNRYWTIWTSQRRMKQATKAINNNQSCEDVYNYLFQ